MKTKTVTLRADTVFGAPRASFVSAEYRGKRLEGYFCHASETQREINAIKARVMAPHGFTHFRLIQN